jgi:peroxisomal enoyl-CoA hydratase 2
MGFTAKAVYEKFCNKDPNLLKKIGTRFTSHFFPGETYVIEMWKEGNTIIF